jgi:hypothetical protein
MGSKLSTASNITSLLDRSKEDIANMIVVEMGPLFLPYSESIVQHNVDGAVIWSFRNEFSDISNMNLVQHVLIHDLNITNSIHQRVLYLKCQNLVRLEEGRQRNATNDHCMISSDSVGQQSLTNATVLPSEDDEFNLINVGSTIENHQNHRGAFGSLSIPSTLVTRKDNDHIDAKVVLRGYGPINDVTEIDVLRYEPSPTNVLLKPQHPRRSSMLPIFHNEWSANRIENLHYKDHIPENYYHMADQLNSDHTPIHIHDAERIALVESFSLQSITPTDPTGIALKRITVRSLV